MCYKWRRECDFQTTLDSSLARLYPSDMSLTQSEIRRNQQMMEIIKLSPIHLSLSIMNHKWKWNSQPFGSPRFHFFFSWIHFTMKNLVLCSLMLFLLSLCTETSEAHLTVSSLRSEDKAVDVMASLPSSIGWGEWGVVCGVYSQQCSSLSSHECMSGLSPVNSSNEEFFDSVCYWR